MYAFITADSADNHRLGMIKVKSKLLPQWQHGNILPIQMKGGDKELMEPLRQSAEVLRDKRRLRWACRRGMLELDVLFLPFVEEAYDELTDEQQAVFRRLITCDDPDLFAWFMGHQSCPDPEMAEMVRLMLSRVKV